MYKSLFNEIGLLFRATCKQLPLLFLIKIFDLLSVKLLSVWSLLKIQRGSEGRGPPLSNRTQTQVICDSAQYGLDAPDFHCQKLSTQVAWD